MCCNIRMTPQTWQPTVIDQRVLYGYDLPIARLKDTTYKRVPIHVFVFVNNNDCKSDRTKPPVKHFKIYSISLGLDVPIESEYKSIYTVGGSEYKGLYVPPATESDYGYTKGGTLPPLSGPIRGYGGGSLTDPSSLRDHESPGHVTMVYPENEGHLV